MGTSRSRMDRKDKLPHRPSDFISGRRCPSVLALPWGSIRSYMSTSLSAPQLGAALYIGSVLFPGLWSSKRTRLPRPAVVLQGDPDARRSAGYFSVSSQSYSALLKAAYCSRRMLCPALLMYTHLNGAFDFQILAAFSAVSLDTIPFSAMMSRVKNICFFYRIGFQAASNCQEQLRSIIIQHIGLINFSLNTPTCQLVIVRLQSCRKLSRINGPLSIGGFS